MKMPNLGIIVGPCTSIYILSIKLTLSNILNRNIMHISVWKWVVILKLDGYFAVLTYYNAENRCGEWDKMTEIRDDFITNQHFFCDQRSTFYL